MANCPQPAWRNFVDLEATKRPFSVDVGKRQKYLPNARRVLANTCFASQGLRFDVDLGNVRGANHDEAEDVTA
jgi:hypothetical protein